MITFLPQGLGALRFWAEMPKFLSLLVEKHTIKTEDKCMCILKRELAPELIKFLMVNTCQELKLVFFFFFKGETLI